VGLRCGGCASSAGGSVRVREAIGDYIVVVVGAQRGGKPRQRVRADEGRGREGRGGGDVGWAPPSVSVSRNGHGGACVPGWLRFAIGSDV